MNASLIMEANIRASSLYSGLCAAEMDKVYKIALAKLTRDWIYLFALSIKEVKLFIVTCTVNIRRNDDYRD